MTPAMRTSRAKICVCMLLALAMLTTGLLPAAAQPPDDPAPQPLAPSEAAIHASEADLSDRSGGEVTIERHAETGFVRFIGTSAGRPVRPVTAVAGDDPADVAVAFAREHAQLIGLPDVAEPLTVLQETDRADGTAVKLQQVVDGVPVIAGELAVLVDGSGAVEALSGELTPLPDVSTAPAIGAEEAARHARDAIARAHDVDGAELTVAAPERWVFDPALLGGPQLPGARLVWRTEVTGMGSEEPLRELVLVDAATGTIALHFNQIAHALNRSICDANNTGNKYPCTAPYARTEGQGPTGIVDVDTAYDFSGDTYDFLSDHFGRDSLDDQGFPLVSTVRYCDPGFACPYQNAFWDGSQMTYGQGFAVQDVVGHEFGHGLDEFTSDLFYYYQSGAIDESLADVWGELIDQTTPGGNDSAGVRWYMGEDLGAIRNMANPPEFGDPDRMGSPNYWTSTGDNGGVHINSGINNKAAYLLVDGGSFNGRTVTGLGVDKVARLYYDTQTQLLTSGSDYNDLADAMRQACNALIGSVMTSVDCTEVNDALLAVQMDATPGSNLPASDAPVCPTGQSPVNAFFDDLESGASNWTATTGVGTGWQHIPDYAYDGVGSLWGTDNAAAGLNTMAMTTGVTIPSNGYLHFGHAHDFEAPDWDGGVVQYSVNGGTWVDAGPLFDFNGYNGTLVSGGLNPLQGRPAFINRSGGFTASRLNLSSLAGQNVRFRFAVGTDELVGSTVGWVVDAVRIYSCAAVTAPGAPTGVTASLGGAQGTAQVGFTAPASDGGAAITSYTVRARNSIGTVVQIATGPASPITVSGLTAGQSYTFTVSATNSVGEGPQSVASAPLAIPVATTVPGAPTGVAARLGDASDEADVTFTPPASNGGATITSYRVRAFDSDGDAAGTANGAASPITVDGLAQGETYTFTVAATNSVGEGPQSAPSSPLTIPVASTVPGPPTGVDAAHGDAADEAEVTFDAPADDGGAAITSYRVRAFDADGDAAGTATGDGSPIIVDGLAQGETYRFTVAARNSVGEGPQSARSGPLTLEPLGTLPGQPTGVLATPGEGALVVTFSPPVEDGGIDVDYVVEVFDAGTTFQQAPAPVATATGSASPITVDGLVDRTAYLVTVTASNAIGEGPRSAPSAAVAPLGVATGISRLDTGSPAIGAVAIDICQYLLPLDDAADRVLLARDDVFADALAGAPLAGDDACILFTPGGDTAALDPTVRTEIDRVLVDGGTVQIMGGELAVSTAVADELTGAGYTVQRFAGPTRFETATTIATAVVAETGTTDALLAFAYNWPDAITGGAFGAASGRPILLTETDALHPATAQTMQALGITTTTILGGQAVIGDAVQAAAPGATRVAGPNRMGTASEVARQLWSGIVPDPDRFIAANLEQDQAWTLALAASPLSAQIGAPQLGVGTAFYPQETTDYLAGLALTDPAAAIIVGGSDLVSTAHEDQLRGQITP